jgi:transcriptional regulator with XRE-family HTH domain
MEVGMKPNLKLWRRRNNLTQIDAAGLLGVSQPYLSLLERGARPLSRHLRDRLRQVHGQRDVPRTDDRFRAQLSALGYPGFAHVPSERPVPLPGVVLLDALAEPTLDARVTDGLPWLVRHYAGELDWPWLTRQAKLRNLQNRLGFLIQHVLPSSPGASQSAMKRALAELDPARLLAESTLCWDAMPAATRRWMREHRSPQAAHWNVVTRLWPEDSNNAPDDNQ